MNTSTLSELVLYRYRYLIGYTLLALLTVGLLTLNITSLPPGLSRGEEASAVASSQIPLDKNFLQNVQAIDLPYHLLQKISLHFFGLGTLGVRLPSVLLAGAAAYFLFLTLRRWFQANVAVVMSILVASSSWFLSFGRIGSPEVMLVFWTSLIIFLATLISQETKHYLAWKALIVVCVGLSLYTPYMIYFFAAAIIAALSQPHLKYLMRYDEKVSFFLGFLGFAVLCLPLAWQIWRNPSIIQSLLAVSRIPEPLEFGSNILGGISNVINPFHYEIGEIFTPLISLPIVALAAIGFIRVLRHFHAVRSYVLLVWLAVLLPIMGLDSHNNLVMLFVPIILLCAIGVQALVEYWYKLFPFNPYARIFGLIPLGLLIISVLQFNYIRYFIAVPYAATTVVLYDPDPLLLHGIVTTPRLIGKAVTMVVSPEKVALYKINQEQFRNLTITTPAEFVPTSTTNAVIAETALSKLNGQQLGGLNGSNIRLVVDSHAEDALRFRVYTH